jgi:hypothetical protein
MLIPEPGAEFSSQHAVVHVEYATPMYSAYMGSFPPEPFPPGRVSQATSWFVSGRCLVRVPEAVAGVLVPEVDQGRDVQRGGHAV